MFLIKKVQEVISDLKGAELELRRDLQLALSPPWMPALGRKLLRMEQESVLVTEGDCSAF